MVSVIRGHSRFCKLFSDMHEQAQKLARELDAIKAQVSAFPKSAIDRINRSLITMAQAGHSKEIIDHRQKLLDIRLEAYRNQFPDLSFVTYNFELPIFYDSTSVEAEMHLIEAAIKRYSICFDGKLYSQRNFGYELLRIKNCRDGLDVLSVCDDDKRSLLQKLEDLEDRVGEIQNYTGHAPWESEAGRGITLGHLDQIITQRNHPAAGSVTRYPQI